MTTNRHERRESLHHTYWTKNDYNRDPVTRRLRNDSRTHVVLADWVHTELHREIEPVGRPITEVGRIALQHLNDAPDYTNKVDYTRDMSAFMYQYDEMLAQNLHDQLPFLILGTKALRRRIL